MKGRYDQVKKAGRAYAKRTFGMTEYDFLDLEMMEKVFLAGYKYAMRNKQQKTIRHECKSKKND